MFSKLLKHEWKSNAGLMGILALAAVGVGIVGTLALRVLVNYGEKIAVSDSVLSLLLLPLALLVGGSFLALAVYAIAVNFIMLFRFYKNKFTDEGYLTFTLPVKTSHIFLSSAINMLIWMVISTLLTFALIIGVVMVGSATHGFINENIIDGFRAAESIWSTIGDSFKEILGVGYGPLSVISLIVTPVYSVVLSMTCITLGAVVAKKHKILAAIGISYGASIVLSIITSIVTSIPSLLFIGDTSMERTDLYFTLTMVLQLLIYVGVIIGGYFLSTHLMKHKLNLP